MSADVSVSAYADQLRQFAGHFALRDWEYTRNTGDLHSVRYDLPEDSPLGRLRRALGWLLKPQPAFAKGWGPNRFYMFAHVIKRDRHLPDGMLDGGGILTFWEETGEYLQYVQPSVGLLLADWMDAEPDSPHAQKVAAEMKRIYDGYCERIDATGGRSV